MADDNPRYRLFVDQALGAGAAVEATPAQAHYLGNVLRLKAGASVALFNGRDGEWRARLGAVGRGRARLDVVSRTREQVAVPDLWLIFAAVKRAATDLIVQKATELGAARVVPVTTARTNVSRIAGARLGAIAVEAAEQCNRLSVPEIAPATTLDRLVADWPARRRLVVCHPAGGAPPAGVFDGAAGRPWAILVGPEGGFAPAEVERLSRQPFTRVLGLGPRALRAETAAVAAMTLWQASLGDWYK